MVKRSAAGKKVPDFREWLSSLSDNTLTELLRLRPDTVLPLPPGIPPLAARLQLRASLVRALQHVDVGQLVALEALIDLGAANTPVSAPEVVDYVTERCAQASALAPEPTVIEHSLEQLCHRALAWPTDDGYCVVSEVLSALPTGWRRLPDSAKTAEELKLQLSQLPARQRKIIETLDRSGGLGITKDAAPDADPSRPIPQLIQMGLLIRVDAGSVRLPESVRLALHGQRREPLTIPQTAPVAWSDEQGLGAGLEVIRQMRVLLKAIGEQPISTLKGGAIGIRERGRVAKQLELDESTTARLLCLAVSAGLVARGVPEPLPQDDDGGDYYAPTPRADEWLTLSLGARWRMLLDAWAHSTWQPWLVGDKDPKGNTIHVLSATTKDAALPEVRQQVIALWRAHGPVASTDMTQLFRYAHPLTSIPNHLLEQLTVEADWLGARTSVLTGTDPETLMPQPTEQLIAQGDMTILAPGPLTPRVQRLMDTIAELESSGLASVYRLTDASIRRGLDAGLTGQEILAGLRDYSLTELRQAAVYLVDDVARRHGSLRGGPAMSYLRCDDPSLLLHAVQLVGDRLAMRVVAPTVAISQAPLINVIRELREHGLQPAAEDALGVRLDLVDEPSRVPTPRPAPIQSTLDDNRIAAAVAAIRRNEAEGVKSGRPTGEAIDPAQTLSVLKTAAAAGHTVTLGFVDKHGVAVHRVVRPMSVSAGVVDAMDPATGTVHRFQLHRITEVLVAKD